MIAIVDYGMGNLRSVQKALEHLGFDAVITSDKRVMRDAGHIILPGVGAAADAMKSLGEAGLDEELVRQAQSGKPFLGICLGMQVMLDRSFENGEHKCLGLIKGDVVPFSWELDEKKRRVPHMGWNSLMIKDNPLFSEQEDDQYVYFVHSYHADGVSEESVIARTYYGKSVVCGVRDGNVYGLQFHPEKSGETGLKMLEQFAGLK